MAFIWCVILHLTQRKDQMSHFFDQISAICLGEMEHGEIDKREIQRTITIRAKEKERKKKVDDKFLK